MEFFVRLIFIIGIVMTIVAGECEEPCENSDCIDNVCQCHPGYRPGGKFNCVFDCGECGNGLCAGPNTCQCLNSQTKCISASCTKQGTCKCFDGFEFTIGNNTKCESSCLKACAFGKCSDDLKECICNEGYKIYADGNCYRERKKECPANYKLNQNDICEPICGKLCENGGGRCIAPQKCECEPNCIFGQCDGGQCECNAGYHLRNNSSYDCVPNCESDCIDGVCNEQGICNCNNGFIKLNGECIKEPIEKTCARKCVNSDCIGFNTCECHLGFHFCWKNGTNCKENYIQLEKPSDGDSCTPKCTPNCINADCITSNVCKCHDGYAKELNSRNKCVIIGGRGVVRYGDECINCECDDTSNCTCHEGYRQVSEKECVPKCDECGNGYCIEPNVCQCVNPQISCTNASCTIDNKCKCNNGYKIKNDTVNNTICTKNIPNDLLIKPTSVVCNSDEILNSNGKCEKINNKSSNKSNIFLIIIIIIAILLCIGGLILLIKKIWLRRKSKVWRNPEIQYTAGEQSEINEHRTHKLILT